MAAIARSQSSSCSNPVLDVFTSVSGVLTNVYSLQYQIFDKTTGSAVQVYPITPGQKATVVVGTDCPTGDRLGTGHYVARWDVPANENIGTHETKWYIKLTSGSSEQTYLEEFEVLAEVVAAGDPNAGYAFVQDLRDEGLTNTTTYPDAWVQAKIMSASRFIDMATRRFFYPKELTLRLDGRGGPMLLLSDPIIAIEYVKQEIAPFYDGDFSLLEGDSYRVYNRHLTQQLNEPDDRANPKIELFNPGYLRLRGAGGYAPLVFPRGQQNVEIKGWFGYTDYDGTSKGKTPEMIRFVCKLLVLRDVDKLTQRSDARIRSRIISESTRDQSYTLEGLGALKLVGAGFTGDPEIDNILSYFTRPPAMGAA